jgi:N-acetylmuramoyl-L-alanine amidase
MVDMNAGFSYGRSTSELIRLPIFVFVGLVGLLLAPDGRAQESVVQIDRISFAERSDGNGYVVRLHADRSPGTFIQERTGSSEVVLTVFQAALSRGFERDEPSGPVTEYSANEADGNVRIRFHLSSERELDTEVYQDANSTDLLVGVTERTEESPPVQVVSGSNNSQPYVLSREAREKWKLDCVVIDPGHGGHDPGSQAHGVEEKDIVLDVALQLGEYIEQYLNLRVVYTRTTDRFVPLHERGRIANEKCGKLFVSIHANALSGGRSRGVHGTETYILGLHKTEQARQVMERENSVIELEDNPDRYENINEEELVVQSLAQNMYMRESEILAEKIENQFANRAMRHSRGVKQAGFLVLWRASMPAVLVELGFVSNPGEARYLSSEDGKAYLASAIFRAVRAYKAEYEKGLDFAADE